MFGALVTRRVGAPVAAGVRAQADQQPGPCRHRGRPGRQAVVCDRRTDIDQPHRGVAPIKEAADLGPRRALTGEPLAPTLAGAAAAQREGKLGAGQVTVIRRFLSSVARLGRCRHPRQSRSRSGRTRHPLPARTITRRCLVPAGRRRRFRDSKVGPGQPEDGSRRASSTLGHLAPLTGRRQLPT